MRLALLVGSSYEKNGKLTAVPSAEIDGDLMERRLTEVDAGFKVIRFNAERGLAERIEQRLIAQTEPITELLVYFSGYSVLSEDRGPALLLDGERLGTLSLTRLRNLFLLHSTNACLIVDAAAVVDSGQSLSEVVSSIGTTLTENAPSVSALVAVRNSALPDSFGGSAFTGLVLMMLDWLAASRERSQPIDLRSLYDGLRADEQTWKDVPAAGLFGEQTSLFAILTPDADGARTLVVPAGNETEAPLPSFANDRDLDALLGLRQQDEAKTQPGLQAFEDPDEVTPTRPHLPPSGSDPESAPPASEFDRAPLPSFDFAEATEPNRASSLPSSSEVLPSSNDALPSFDFADTTEPNQPTLLADGDASGARLAPQAPKPEPASENPDEVAARVLESSLALAHEASDRAGVLAKLARVVARLGRGEQAARLFGEAVELDALNLDVLKVRAEWAEAARDSANLLHTAEAWLRVAPGDLRALALLGQACESLGDARRSIEVRQKLADHPECAPDERKRALMAAARLARAELADFELADRLDEKARGAAVAPALAPVEAAPPMAEAAAPPLEVAAPAEASLPAPASEKPASGREAHRARVREYERAIQHNPRDTTLRERLIELYDKLDERPSALDHCRSAAHFSPTHPATYRLAHALFLAEGDPDGAWNAASVLECLGEADINESLMVSQHRPEGLLAARSTVSETEWTEALFSPQRDRELSSLLTVLAPAAARVGTGFAKHKGRYQEPDPKALQDPEKSTTMLAKTLAWTARMLGVSAPALYVLPELDTDLRVAMVEQPSTLANRALGSGLGLGQLAFLWGRHLARFRNEICALSFFSSHAELMELLRAALALGGSPHLDVRSLDGDAKRLYAALRREVRGAALERLQAVAASFWVDDLEVRAEAALRELALLGVRAGLSVSGDVCGAAELIRRFPAEGLASVDEQLGELYAFAISRQYASLRQRMGVAVAA
ncbi:MAG: hypothetical protein ACOY0T_14255 [Myxococcota bacterium]